MLRPPQHNQVSATKRRGGYFTPVDLATALAQWAIRSPRDSVIDPAAGHGVFLRAAYHRLSQLGARHPAKNLCGIELHGPYLERAREYLPDAQWIQADFFKLNPWSYSLRQFDVMLCNPPYVRYQLFRGTKRARALGCAQAAGVTLNNQSNSWAPYVVHAARFVRQGGRVAFVLPQEFASAEFALPIRRWLLQDFSPLKLILFDKRIFPNVLSKTVLVLGCKNSRPNNTVQVLRLESLHDLAAQIRHGGTTQQVYASKWNSLWLRSNWGSLFDYVGKSGHFQSLGELASVDIGLVTGANSYFVLSPSDARRWNIPSHALHPILTKGRQLTGLAITKRDWGRISGADTKSLLLNSLKVRPHAKLARYLDLGRRLGINRRFKVASRSPWHLVMPRTPPHAFLSYVVNGFPKLVWNRARCLSTNSLHNVRFRRRPDRALFVAFHNTVTHLTAELAGRPCGGGGLKLEPSQAESLALPHGAFVEKSRSKLREIYNDVDTLLRKRALDHAMSLVDQVLLLDTMQMSPSRYRDLRRALEELRSSRLPKRLRTL